MQKPIVKHSETAWVRYYIVGRLRFKKKSAHTTNQDLFFSPKSWYTTDLKASHMAEVRVKGLARVTHPEGKSSIQLHRKASGSGSGEELGPIFGIDRRYSITPEKLSSFPGSTKCGTSQVTFYRYLFIFLLVRSLEVSCWFFILANLPLLIKIHVVLDVKRTL